MPFVKLDCQMLDSTTWLDREAREIFITALLMARPYELQHPQPQIRIRSLRKTGWSVPAGWYGFVPAAGVGIVKRAGIDLKSGLRALDRLGSPERDSRSRDYEGRRLVRIDGGFIILNFMRHWDRDETGAERQRRYRLRQAELRRLEAEKRRNGVTIVTSRNEVTNKIKEVEVEVDRDKELKSKTTTPAPTALSPKRQSWVLRLAEIWVNVYKPADGKAPIPKIGKLLLPVKDAPDLERRFTAYVTQTPAQFVNLVKFVETFGSWGNGKAAPQTYQYEPGVKGPAL